MSKRTWVVPGITNITSYFGYRKTNIPGATENHKGIDIGAPYGTGIVAMADGKVISSGPARGYGQWIRIDHGNGMISIYGHMQQRLVDVGDQVKAGQLIAYVGSEGISSGPHLHFQLERNNLAVNPLKYISPDGSGAVISTANPDMPISSTYITEFEGKVYPETIAGISSQPLMPFVEFVVGEQSLTLMPPTYVVSFEFRKSIDNSANRFTITIFDDNWEEVEYLCSHNQDSVKLRYGYSGGAQSKFYSAKLMSYSISFNSTGVLLNIEGQTTGTTVNLVNLTMDTNTLNPTEAAKIVAREAGWQVLDENFHPSYTIQSANRDSYALINERPATYIINKLAPLAIRTWDEQGGFRFYLDETEEPPVAYFRPIDFSEDTKRTYVYMKGIDSPVIDLQLKVNGVWGGSYFGELVTTEEVTTFIDPESGEEIEASEKLNDDVPEAVGDYSHTSSSQYSSTIDAAGSSRSEMNALLRSRVSSSSIPYEGFLTIVGDPTINLPTAGDETIRLIILDDYGNLHHTSGLYQISSITDTIESGIMQTSMHITRLQDIERGIELVNSRKRKK